MDDESSAKKDPFLTIEELMADACHKIAHQVDHWQKAHQAADRGFQLVRQFNQDSKQLAGNEELYDQYTTFANVSGVTFCNLATDLQRSEDPAVALGTSQVLLSGLQSNVASFVSSVNFDLNKPYGFARRLLSRVRRHEA
jgi:hypothetical protein